MMTKGGNIMQTTQSPKGLTRRQLLSRGDSSRRIFCGRGRFSGRTQRRMGG